MEEHSRLRGCVGAAEEDGRPNEWRAERGFTGGRWRKQVVHVEKSRSDARFGRRRAASGSEANSRERRGCLLPEVGGRRYGRCVDAKETNWRGSDEDETGAESVSEEIDDRYA